MRSPIRLSVLGLLACLAGSTACGRGSTPDIDVVAPQAICTEQGTATITVSGHGLSPMVRRGLTDRPEAVAPTVSLVRSQAIAVESSQPAQRSLALSSSSVRWLNQSSLGFDVVPGEVGPGVFDIEIRNPNGEVTRLADGLVIAPPPVARALEPEVITGDQPNTVTVRGDFFLARSDAQPTVLLHGVDPDPLTIAAAGVADCTALPGPGSPQLCRAVTLTLPQGTLPPGAFTVEVVNPAPASCTTHGLAAGAEGRLPLTVVPRPKLATIGPGVSCTAETDSVLTVTGEGFLVHGDGAPTLMLGSVPLPTTAENCTNVALEPGFAPRARALSSCTDLRATLPVGSMPPGVVTAVVQNPPTSPGTSYPVQYLVAGPPIVSGVASDVVCSGKGGDAVKLLGEGFLKVAGQTPVVRFGATEVPAAPGACTPVTGLAQPVEVCTELTAKLPKDSLAGPYGVVVRNPAAAPCSSIQPITVVNVAPPTITKVAPPRFCGAVASKLTLTGTDFLVLAGAVPTVEIGGAEVTAVPEKCLPVAGSLTGAMRCTGLDLTVPAGAAAGKVSQAIKVKNPVPADCGATAPVPVEVAPPPVISSARVSASVGGAAVILISGSGFLPGAKISVGGIATSGGAVVSPTSAIAVVAPGASAAGGATVTIDNADGCAASASVSVGGLPFIGAAAPGVGAAASSVGANASGAGANASTMGATASVAGATADASRSPLLSTRAALSSVTTPLTITGADGAVSVALRGPVGSAELPFAADPLRPGHVLAALPPGTAAGSYDVVVTGRDGRSETAGRLEVVDVVASVADAGTVVVAQGEGARLEVADDGGAGLPVAFLVPSGAGEAAVAVPLAGVARRANGTLEASTAGPSLDPGDYDLLLVGPARDGAAAEARVAPRALHVAPSGPAAPELDAVGPGLPAPRPGIVAVSLVSAETGGLAAGTWHYRVSALLASGGETVPSEPAGVDVPDDAGRPVAIEVEWARVDGAVDYRVYRTAAPGEPAGAEQLVAETRVDATRFVDDGEPVETVP